MSALASARDLLQRLAERRSRILDAGAGDRRRPIAAQRAHRLERVAGGAAQQRIVRRFRVRVSNDASHPFRRARRTHRRHRRRAPAPALQRAGHLPRDCDAAKRTRLRPRRLQVAVQPAVTRALHARRGGLHVVLRVEVRPRAIGRAARVDDGERACCPRAASAAPCADAGRRSRRARWRRPARPAAARRSIGRSR